MPPMTTKPDLADRVDVIVLVKADDPKGTPQLYACGKCGSVHSPRIYACRDDLAHEAARKAAENCYACAPNNICVCGNECSKGRTVCQTCREQNRLDKAIEIPDDGGPYCAFGGDEYYFDLESAEDDNCEWVSPCKATYPRIDIDNVFDNLLSDMHEDADVSNLFGADDFERAVGAFNKSQTVASYFGDETRKIKVPSRGHALSQEGPTDD